MGTQTHAHTAAMPEPMTMLSLAGYLWGLYGTYKVVRKVDDWSKAHRELNQALQLKQSLEQTQGTPGEYPFKQDGFYDQRCKPFPAMRKAIEQMTVAVQNKDEKMFLLGADAIGCDSDLIE